MGYIRNEYEQRNRNAYILWALPKARAMKKLKFSIKRIRRKSIFNVWANRWAEIMKFMNHALYSIKLKKKGDDDTQFLQCGMVEILRKISYTGWLQIVYRSPNDADTSTYSAGHHSQKHALFVIINVEIWIRFKC